MSFILNELPDGDYTEPGYVEPKMWKSLGRCMDGMVEAHYGMDHFNGALDVDREGDLRVELDAVARALHAAGNLMDGMVLGRNARPYKVRFVRPEPVTLWTTKN